MNNFVFENKTKVYFGKGGVKEYLGGLLKNYGDTVMLAYGGGSIKRNGVYDEVVTILNAAGKRIIEFGGIMSNPTYVKVQEGAALARAHQVDLILAVGGGSVSDCCKVISTQAKVDEDLWKLENAKHTIPTHFIPIGTIVTVFGSGSEMNSGAVITHKEKKIKGALWGAQADFAFIDPMYTLSVPMKQVISGAFDTLTHAMETYFGKPNENNLSDDLGEAVMRSTIRNIRVLLNSAENYEARSELAWASAMAENGILKIGKCTDFQCHMIEHQLGLIRIAIMVRGWRCFIPFFIAIFTKPIPFDLPTGRSAFGALRLKTMRKRQRWWVSMHWRISSGRSVYPPHLQSLAFRRIPIYAPWRIQPFAQMVAAKNCPMMKFMRFYKSVADAARSNRNE